MASKYIKYIINLLDILKLAGNDTLFAFLSSLVSKLCLFEYYTMYNLPLTIYHTLIWLSRKQKSGIYELYAHIGTLHNILTQYTTSTCPKIHGHKYTIPSFPSENEHQTLEAYNLPPWCVGGKFIYHPQCSGCDYVYLNSARTIDDVVLLSWPIMSYLKTINWTICSTRMSDDDSDEYDHRVKVGGIVQILYWRHSLVQYELEWC